MEEMEMTCSRTCQKIIDSLTGQYFSDKEMLLNGISFLRKKHTFQADYDVKLLGQKLYALLCENGLNESDVLNASRLFDKVDVFIFEKKYEEALELLEVIDSQEMTADKTISGVQIFYVNNFLEEEMLRKLYFKDNKPFFVEFSNRNFYLLKKYEIYHFLDDRKNEIAVLEEILRFNPINFAARLEIAKIQGVKRPEKFKRLIDEAFKVAYTSHDLIDYLIQLSFYFKVKKKFSASYACLMVVGRYDDISLVSKEIKELILEANRSSTGVFNELSKEEVDYFIELEKIPKHISSSVITLISKAYLFLYENKETKEGVLDFCEKIILDFSNGNTEFLKGLKKLAKEKGEK